MKSVPLRVVIAEDQLLLREGIARLLAEAGFDVVAQSPDAEDLVRKVADDYLFTRSNNLAICIYHLQVIQTGFKFTYI